MGRAFLPALPTVLSPLGLAQAAPRLQHPDSTSALLPKLL